MNVGGVQPLMRLMSFSLKGLSHRVPALAAIAAAVVGATNLASALTPNIRWRGHLLLEFEPVEAMRLFHALALPAGVALLLVAPYLAKRRRRALQTAVVLMAALGVFDLLKGLDFEEMIITWSAGIILLTGRDAFRVRHDPITLRSAIWRAPLVGLIGVAMAALVTWATQGHPPWGTVLTATMDLLRWQPGPIHYHHHIPIGVHVLEISTLLMIAYLIFRPLTAPRALPSVAVREVASELVRAHGTDTLAFFKLRADKQYLFSQDRRSRAIRWVRRMPFPGCCTRCARSPRPAGSSWARWARAPDSARCTKSSVSRRSTWVTRRWSSSAASRWKADPSARSASR
jgi:lysylphosphatidylglycerol synthetase-like protein (DUF2156 family)